MRVGFAGKLARGLRCRLLSAGDQRDLGFQPDQFGRRPVHQSLRREYEQGTGYREFRAANRRPRRRSGASDGPAPQAGGSSRLWPAILRLPQRQRAAVGSAAPRDDRAAVAERLQPGHRVSRKVPAARIARNRRRRDRGISVLRDIHEPGSIWSRCCCRSYPAAISRSSRLCLSRGSRHAPAHTAYLADAQCPERSAPGTRAT
jgi:hypothetical protein